MTEKENPETAAVDQDDATRQSDAQTPISLETDAQHDADSSEFEMLRRDLEEARQKAAEHLNLAKRVQADAENEKKRIASRIELERKYMLQDFVKDLLEVKDNLERSLQESENASSENLREGIDLTLKSFARVLEKSGVEELNPIGEPFNPELHEAVRMRPSEAHSTNTVIEVIQKGYRLNERLLRAAMVVVAQQESPQNMDSDA